MQADLTRDRAERERLARAYLEARDATLEIARAYVEGERSLGELVEQKRHLDDCRARWTARM